MRFHAVAALREGSSPPSTPLRASPAFAAASQRSDAAAGEAASARFAGSSRHLTSPHASALRAALRDSRKEVAGLRKAQLTAQSAQAERVDGALRAARADDDLAKLTRMMDAKIDLAARAIATRDVARREAKRLAGTVSSLRVEVARRDKTIARLKRAAARRVTGNSSPTPKTPSSARSRRRTMGGGGGSARVSRSAECRSPRPSPQPSPLATASVSPHPASPRPGTPVKDATELQVLLTFAERTIEGLRAEAASSSAAAPSPRTPPAPPTPTPKPTPTDARDAECIALRRKAAEAEAREGAATALAARSADALVHMREHFSVRAVEFDDASVRCVAVRTRSALACRPARPLISHCARAHRDTPRLSPLSLSPRAQAEAAAAAAQSEGRRLRRALKATEAAVVSERAKRISSERALDTLRHRARHAAGAAL